MDIRSIQGSGVYPAASSSPVTASASSGETFIGGASKNDFLKLLVAQLQNQDPMKPMEDTQFIAQMAQLNTVEQLTAMNNQLTEFLNSQALSQASALIGKTVEAAAPGGSVINGIVEEVRVQQGKPILVVNGKSVNPADVWSISPGK